jgi:hypothetical protein
MDKSIGKIHAPCNEPKHPAHNKNESYSTGADNWGISLPRIHVVLKVSSNTETVATLIYSAIRVSFASACPGGGSDSLGGLRAWDAIPAIHLFQVVEFPCH